VTAEGLNMRSGIYNLVAQNANASTNATGISNRLTPGGTGSAFGIQNWLMNSGTGPKYGYHGNFFQSANSSQPLHGIYYFNRNYGTGKTYGLYQLTLSSGTGEKFGLWSSVSHPVTAATPATGVLSYVKNEGSGVTYGYQAQIPAQGQRAKYGYYAQVFENNNSLASTHGIYAETHLNGAAIGYGIYNNVRDAGTSSNVKYGIYNRVEDHASNGSDRYGIFTYLQKKGTGNRYALFAQVEGNTDYAGFFQGNVVVTGSLTYGTSDRRLKENLNPLSNSLSLIRQLRPMRYRFKQDQGINLPAGGQYGLIAQEVEEILPDLVTEYVQPGQPIIEKRTVQRSISRVAESDGSGAADLGKGELSPTNQLVPSTEIVEEEIEEIVGYTDPATYKAINYQGLIPVLVGALQEQSALVEKMEARILQLERQLAKVEVSK
ncbi:MAG: tail fiber domain-containing protein, partial [Bacteroidota bacterium]